MRFGVLLGHINSSDLLWMRTPCCTYLVKFEYENEITQYYHNSLYNMTQTLVQVFNQKYPIWKIELTLVNLITHHYLNFQHCSNVLWLSCTFPDLFILYNQIFLDIKCWKTTTFFKKIEHIQHSDVDGMI